MNEPIIQVEKLNVTYNKGKPNEVRSLEGINVKIFPHEYVIIYGPSGCGKSTLLYSMSGLQAATEGEVTVEGKKISQMKKKEIVELHQVGIGMIFQAFYLIPSLKVIDNVCLPKVFRGEPRDKRLEDGIKLLHRFSIVEQAGKFPGQLSGGQKQRVSIARSLINNPQIIFADEPVGNLDSVSAENVMQILKDLNEIDKKTIVLVTHNPEHLHFADRIIYLKDGRLIREEVIKEKRPLEAVKTVPDIKYEELSNELKLLMRTFKNLSLGQVGSLLVPFKANQLLSHILSELNEEQIQTAGSYLKEFLFNNIDIYMLKKNLDTDYSKGGAGWNRQRVKSFINRLEGIVEVSKIVSEGKEGDNIAESLSRYLINYFRLDFKEEMKRRFNSFLEMRIKNKIDRIGLQKGLDAPKVLGGVGLYKNTSEKISREVEIIMLMKYSTF
jgi:putative ABC transport system ATP-binding protein